jgi:TldD protein
VDSSAISLTREEKTFASTEGALWTQTLYTTGGGFQFSLRNPSSAAVVGRGSWAWPAKGMGWEYIGQPALFAQCPALVDDAIQRARVPVKPVDIGRYEMVCDAETMARLVDVTIGTATQLDRALGYEANAGGTSYLNDPLAMLGTFKAGSSLVTVTGDRSVLHGAATVKWDDEGVTPEDFTLVKEGVLVDFQTTREQAGWLAPWYQRQHRPIHSHGCADAPDALSVTMQHTPNIAMAPGAADVSVDDLIANVKDGIYVERGIVDTDFQCKNGVIDGRIREIKKGKLGPVLQNAGVMFDTVGLWGNVAAIGGARSQVMGTGASSKGQPGQTTIHSVRAVPAQIHNATVIDRSRKV